MNKDSVSMSMIVYSLTKNVAVTVTWSLYYSEKTKSIQKTEQNQKSKPYTKQDTDIQNTQREAKHNDAKLNSQC